MAANPKKTAQLILNTLKPDQTPTKWESDFVETGANWEDFCIRAIVFGLAPLLYKKFSDWNYAPPARAEAKLKALYEAHRIRNVGIANQVGELIEACSVRGITPTLLKGAHLAAKYYPAPATRPMNDIDILFSPDEIVSAETILQELGYGGKHKSSDLGAGVTKHTSTYRREKPEGATPNPYLSTTAEPMIEPHVSLEESWYGLKVDITKGIRQRVVRDTFSGHRAYVLEPTDLLLHLCVHVSFHLIMGAPSMVQLVDLLIVLQKELTDWDAFVQRSVAQKAAPFSLAALTLAQNLLSAPVPEQVFHQLKMHTPPALKTQIEGFGLDHILRRTQQKPITSVPDRIRRGFHDRAETARWAQDARSRFEVWKTLFMIWRTDTGRMLIKENN